MLHEERGPRQSPVDPELEQRAAQVVGRGPGQHGHLGGQALEGGPHHMGG